LETRQKANINSNARAVRFMSTLLRDCIQHSALQH
jgi:hypothetical protein